LACDKTLAALKPILEDERIAKVGHNIKYDVLVMRNAGVNVRGVVLDSMVGGGSSTPAACIRDRSSWRSIYLKFKKIPTLN
jgi:DNA polymerase-1